MLNKLDGKIIVISGPSGSGKTTLYSSLMKKASLRRKLARTISVTTREKRGGEINGKDYFFISRREFINKIKQGQFLEHEKVFDNYYGTLKSQVRQKLEQGKNVVLAIDVKGAKTVKALHKKAVLIFIKPPSTAILKARLVKRGTEDKKTLNARLKRAFMEMKQAGKYDYVVVNNGLKQATQKLENIITYVIKGKGL